MSEDGLSAREENPDTIDPRHELKDKLKDLGIGFVLVGIAVFLIYHINTQTAVFAGTSGGVSFYSVPTVCGILLIGLVVVYATLSLKDIMVIRRTLGAHEFHAALRQSLALPRVDSGMIRRVGTIVLLVAFVLSLRAFPFAVSTGLFLALMFILYGQRSPIWIGTVTLVGTSALTALFVYALRLPL